MSILVIRNRLMFSIAWLSFIAQWICHNEKSDNSPRLCKEGAPPRHPPPPVGGWRSDPPPRGGIPPLLTKERAGVRYMKILLPCMGFELFELIRFLKKVAFNFFQHSGYLLLE